MEVIFQNLFPKEIKGSLVYERTQVQNRTDSIDELLVEVMKNVSNQISDEPADISQQANVTFSNFDLCAYHSQKFVKLHLKNMDDNNISPFILRITVRFDTAELPFIETRVKDEQYFNVHRSAFYKLKTLIVQ